MCKFRKVGAKNRKRKRRGNQKEHEEEEKMNSKCSI